MTDIYIYKYIRIYYIDFIAMYSKRNSIVSNYYCLFSEHMRIVQIQFLRLCGMRLSITMKLHIYMLEYVFVMEFLLIQTRMYI